MSDVRSDLSKKNKWWIPKYRYYELKYFCLQYDDYRRDTNLVTHYVVEVTGAPKEFSDPTGNAAVNHLNNRDKIKVINDSATAADSELANYILLAVTKDYTYTYLSMVKSIPCCRNTFYDRYRKFFWILDKRV